MFKRSHVHWTNTLFFIFTPFMAIGGTLWWIQQNLANMPTVLFAILYWCLAGLSITAGYHRLFSHKSYRAHWSIKLLLTCFGSSTFEGPVFVWASDHRNHHKYQDTPKDPYAIQKGFWYAHVFWLFDNTRKPTLDNISDLKKDPLLNFQNRHYPLIAIITGLIFPMAIASLWGDPWGGLFVAGLLRMVLNQHVTFAINSVCHTFGAKPYSTNASARDNALTALFTFGEGYHNFHHQFPHDYRNGIHWYQWDPTKWLVSLLSWVGLASQLKKAPALQIHEKRIAAEEYYVQQMLSNQSESDHVQSAFDILNSAKAQYRTALHELSVLNDQYQRLKDQKHSSLKSQLKAMKKELRIARQNLKTSIMMWQHMVKGIVKLQHA